VLPLEEIRALVNVPSGCGFEDRRDAALLAIFPDTGAPRLGEVRAVPAEANPAE
jgi:hypothetical protein